MLPEPKKYPIWVLSGGRKRPVAKMTPEELLEFSLELRSYVTYLGERLKKGIALARNYGMSEDRLEKIKREFQVNHERANLWIEVLETETRKRKSSRAEQEAA